MNRPKKNKIQNDTLPADQQVDERNLIDLEEAEEVSLEDRIHLYWMENKGFVSACFTVLALLIIAFNGMRMYRTQAESKIQAAYNDALANETLAEFALDYSNKALGGFAALDVADVAYNQEDFERAIEFYSIAANAIENDLVVGRARIGLAFSSYYSGKTEEGLNQLKALAADSSLSEAVRSEAAYHLAIDADVNGDNALFESYANQVSSVSKPGQWQQRMQVYQQQK